MLKETNLDGVKSMARMLLMTPIHKTPYSPAVVQHPFVFEQVSKFAFIVFYKPDTFFKLKGRNIA